MKSLQNLWKELNLLISTTFTPFRQIQTLPGKQILNLRDNFYFFMNLPMNIIVVNYIVQYFFYSVFFLFCKLVIIVLEVRIEKTLTILFKIFFKFVALFLFFYVIYKLFKVVWWLVDCVDLFFYFLFFYFIWYGWWYFFLKGGNLFCFYCVLLFFVF